MQKTEAALNFVDLGQHLLQSVCWWIVVIGAYREEHGKDITLNYKYVTGCKVTNILQVIYVQGITYLSIML